jgi:threonine dehydrogenase-like Zn-dependent dehydrogenase
LPQVYRGDGVLGHESTGRFVAVGDNVADWAAGERVAVNPNGNVDGSYVYCRSERGQTPASIRRPSSSKKSRCGGGISIPMSSTER